jgi:DNA-binding MarR family transcriptional regulator
MRYPKGSIQLNQSRDLPLLRQILHSEFITRSQLFEFMELNGYERSRNSLDWRMRRLVQRGLVTQQAPVAGTRDIVYSLTDDAAELLQSMGEYCLIRHGHPKAKNSNQSVLHAFGVNDIHLSLLRSQLLVRWTSTMQVRSQNELTDYGFAKDYDAVVTVRTEIGEYRFALEYERTPKAIKYYRAIASSVSQEIHLSRVLYLVPNYDLLRFISRFFGNSQCAVFFGLVADWHSRLLEIPVSSTSSKHPLPFREALDRTAIRPAATPLNYRLPFD